MCSLFCEDRVELQSQPMLSIDCELCRRAQIFRIRDFGDSDLEERQRTQRIGFTGVSLCQLGLMSARRCSKFRNFLRGRIGLSLGATKMVKRRHCFLPFHCCHFIRTTLCTFLSLLSTLYPLSRHELYSSFIQLHFLAPSFPAFCPRSFFTSSFIAFRSWELFNEITRC